MLGLQHWRPDLQCQSEVDVKVPCELLWYKIPISVSCGRLESILKLLCLRIDFFFCDIVSLFLLVYDPDGKSAAYILLYYMFFGYLNSKISPSMPQSSLKFTCWAWGSELKTSRNLWCRWAVTLSFCEVTFYLSFVNLSKGWSSRWHIPWASTCKISTIFGKCRFFRAEIHFSKFCRIQKFKNVSIRRAVSKGAAGRS